MEYLKEHHSGIEFDSHTAVHIDLYMNRKDDSEANETLLMQTWWTK